MQLTPHSLDTAVLRGHGSSEFRLSPGECFIRNPGEIESLIDKSKESTFPAGEEFCWDLAVLQCIDLTYANVDRFVTAACWVQAYRA